MNSPTSQTVAQLLASGMTLEELAAQLELVRRQGQQEPTHPADKALKKGHMDIMQVHVPYAYHEFPRTLYKLREATKRKPAAVLTHTVTSPADQEAAMAGGWSLMRLELPILEEDDPLIEGDALKALLHSSPSTAEPPPPELPMGRLVTAAAKGRPKASTRPMVSANE